MKDKHIIINVSNSSNIELETLQKELFKSGYLWFNYSDTIKTYINGEYILIFGDKLLTISETELKYIKIKKTIIHMDVVTFNRYLKINKLKNYGK